MRDRSLVLAEKTTNNRIGYFLQWLNKGSWAVLDQALFAGTHFVLNILLARWLSPDEYGAFAVAFSIFLLLGAFHTAFLTEPMLVFGPGRYNNRFSDYLGYLIYGHWFISLMASLVLFLSYWFFHSKGQIALANSFFGLALAAPFILLLWLTRRAFYVELNPKYASFGGAFYFIAVCLALLLLYHHEMLSPFWAFIAMAVASALVNISFLVLLRPNWRGLRCNPDFAEAVRMQWTYARWSGATTILTWIPGNIYYSLLPSFVGLGGAGALRATQNVIMPVLHGLSVLSILLVPKFVQVFNHNGKKALFKISKSVSLLFVVLAVFYWVLIIASGPWLMKLLYGDKYLEYNAIIPIIGFLPVSAGIVAVIGGALRAMERPDLVFKSYIITLFSTLTAGIGLTYCGGVIGSGIALLISSLTTAVALAWFYFSGLKT